MADSFIPLRPPTPQALIHRLPDRSDADDAAAAAKPSKHIILLMGSTAVAGKVQIAKTTAEALACPLFQGDSVHDSCAKAASLGANRADPSLGPGVVAGPNKARYQRMWLSKMTRTGLLFPDESRPAGAGFSGFGGAGGGAAGPSSTSTSRRGSASSVDSVGSSALNAAGGGSGGSLASSVTSTSGCGGIGAGAAVSSGPPSSYINKPTFTQSTTVMERRANPALLVLTHPQLEAWHKKAIRETVGEYGLGVVFVPLYREEEDEEEDDEDDEPPVLRPLDPRTMTSFDSFAAALRNNTTKKSDETTLLVDVDAGVEELSQEVISRVRDLIGSSH
ncbi:hypothetical protein BX600DRAFT_62280 [Xylariales sp. PMI_506]|nr:hypothetical protein BX600DRAFT_62280 [Xylariales sp. PMI_506]